MKRSILVLTLVAMLPLSALAKTSERPIVVVKSKENTHYDRFVTGFVVESKLSHVEHTIALNEDNGRKLFERLRKEKPPLILTIGTLAAKLAREMISDIPVIFGLVPNVSQSMQSDNMTGISLNIPLKQQLATLKTLAPNTKNVGVMYNPRHSRKLVRAAVEAAKSLSLKLVTAKIASSDEVADATRAFLGTVDALWMVPDGTVMNPESFRHLLKFTFKHKVPFFSLTHKLVESGALVALAPDFSAIGAQAGKMAVKIIREKVSPKLIPVAGPEGLDIAINLTTARRIGVECDIALEIFTFAATRRYPIKVFK